MTTSLFPGAIVPIAAVPADPVNTALGDPGPYHDEHHTALADDVDAIKIVIGEIGSTDPASIEKRLVDVIAAASSAASAASVADAKAVAVDLDLVAHVATLGTAATTDATDYATAAQGTTADAAAASIAALGTAAALDVGTGPNNVVQLDGTGILPAVDGSQLTGLPSGGVTDHGALTGLADDDHTQYHNDARGDARYALIAKGVTNGDAHDHNGGDGAQIAYSTLSGLPTLGSAAAAATGDFEAAGAVSTHNAVTTAHGISAFGATLVDDADAATARTTLGVPGGSGTSTGTNTGDSATPAETTTTIGTMIDGATSKTTPVDADKVGIWDSVSGLLQAVTWANLKATLNSLFVQLSGGAGTQNLGGKLGLGISPTAVLHLKAGTASANTAPLKFASGTNLTTPEAGAVEYDGKNLLLTQSSLARRGLATEDFVQASSLSLITNGFGMLGDNTGFSSYTFDATDVFVGRGAFSVATTGVALVNDVAMPVDTYSFYLFSLYAKAGDIGGGNYNAANKQYLGFAQYDIDGLLIGARHAEKGNVGSVDTTLAVTLVPGATTMTLTSASGWQNGSSANYRNFCWYGYANSLGYVYPDYTYTRNLSAYYSTNGSLGCWDAGAISGNVITLRVPWAGPTIAAGTAVRNNGSGGTYNYLLMSNFTVPNAWAKYSGVVGGLLSDGTPSINKFRPGVAYVKFVHLCNYHGTADTVVRLNGIVVTNLSSANLESAIGIGANYKTLLTSALPANGLAVEGKTGFGTSSPSAQVHALATTEQVRAGYDAANYESSTTSSAGKTTKALVGTSPDIKWSVSDATTNALYDLATFSKNSTGAGAAGLGARINLAAKSSTTTDTLQGALSASWVDATHATRKARTRIWAADSTGLREGVRIEADGTQVLLGFYGGNAVAKPTALTATVAAAPAGGTGTAAGGWDTSGNRDLAIATINNLKTRVDQLETKLQALGLLT